MKVIELSFERRARLWLDRAPRTPFEGTSVFESLIQREPMTGRPLTHRFVALELLVPLGARFAYGLLGCEAVGDSGQSLKLTVVNVDIANDYLDSLVGNLDRAKWGLPEEYVDGVLSGAHQGVRKRGAPLASQVRFNVAAHGIIGSNAHVFKRLAFAVTALLTAPAKIDHHFLEQLLDDPDVNRQG